MKKLAVAIGLLLLPAVAQAYIDAGSVALVVQLAIAGVAGALAFMKLYWFKTKSFFQKKPIETQNADQERLEEQQPTKI